MRDPRVDPRVGDVWKRGDATVTVKSVEVLVRTRLQITGCVDTTGKPDRLSDFTRWMSEEGWRSVHAAD